MTSVYYLDWPKLSLACRWSECLLYRREEEEEEEPTTATTATQTTDTDDDTAESFEMVELQQQEEIEIIPEVLLHPVPSTSTAGKPSPQPSSSTLSAAQPGQLERLTTEEIAERLHSHGTGEKNVRPGCVLMLTATLTRWQLKCPKQHRTGLNCYIIDNTMTRSWAISEKLCSIWFRNTVSIKIHKKLLRCYFTK